MPTYEYQCSSCGQKHEILHKMSEEPKTICPTCGKKSLEKIIPHSVAIQFQGAGFYSTDYGNKGSCSCCNTKNGCSGCSH